MRRAAHAAKGCIANFVEGAPERTALEIERLGRRDVWTAAGPLVTRLERELADMVAVMRDYETGARCAF